MTTRYLIGKAILWAGWPFFYFYLRGSVRTRVLIVCRNSALVIKVWHSGQKWTLPGGGVRTNETVRLSAVREVYEEVGLTLAQRSLRSLGKEEHSQHGINFTIARFAVRIQKKTRPKQKKLEIIDCAWVSLKKLNDENTDQTTLDHIAEWQSKK